MSYRPARMKFGVFMAPLHHHVGDNPALSYEQDLRMNSLYYDVRRMLLVMSSFSGPT